MKKRAVGISIFFLFLLVILLAGCGKVDPAEEISDAPAARDEVSGESPAETKEAPEERSASDPALFEQLRGYRIGVNTGTLCGKISERLIPDCQVISFNSNTDLALALAAQKIDAYMTDQPIARMLLKKYEDHRVFGVATLDDYGYIFPKNTQKGSLLLSQMNDFLAKLREDGTLQEIDSIWFDGSESVQTVDYDSLTGENGILNFAISSSVGVPFCYLKDGKYVGYDVDIAVRFCQEYGYGIRISDSDFNGVLAGVTAGKCDFGASCITINAERAESVNFSDPNYNGSVVLVVRDTAGASENTDRPPEGKDSSKTDISGRSGSSVKESFERTSLREDRWKLFVDGIGVTILITALAALFGTAIGFLIYLIYRKDRRPVNLMINILSDILEKTPIVVVLMILYYIIFSRSKLSGIWVSVAGFSLIFAGSVMGLLRVAVGAVDGGQMEAALALGYTDTRAFLRVILPQALRHFLPGYRSEIVTLIKSTAIVGYIAVQDLTKISDIIRSRTYEAFFPLIASAIIYIAIAWLLTLLVRGIQVWTDSRRRSAKKILKGVGKND